MIEEQARVVDVDGGFARIVTERQSACGSCAAQKGCGTSLLSAWFPERHQSFELRNDVGAKRGDTVVVGLDERALQRSSLLLYAVPLLGLIVGAVCGEQLFAALGHAGELGAVGVGLLGLIIALVIVRGVSRAGLIDGNGGVKLLRVVHRGSSIAVRDLADLELQQPEGFRK